MHPDKLKKLLQPVIDNAIRGQPRSQQTQIGPSEIGTPCQHCLAAKLAGWTKTEPSTPWLPFIGTSVHAQLENIFSKAGAQWLPEKKVTAGHIQTLTGQRMDITGTADLFHIPTGTVIDWKIVGKTTLDAARHGNVKPTYQVQAHTYGKGYENAGYSVNTVAIAFLPRNDPNLARAVYWLEPYNPVIVEEAFTRLKNIVSNLQILTALNPATRDQWITSQPRAVDCWDCPRYPDWQPPTATLTGLINKKNPG